MLFRSLLASNQIGATSVRELVALAKAKPGVLNYGSAGIGTGPHLVMELFKLDAGLNLLHVPYKGAAGSFVDIIGGRIDAMFQPIHASATYHQQGKLRMLAVLAEERSPVVPNVPTMKEAGYPTVHMENWYGMFAPAGLPQEITTRLNAEINAQLANPAVRETLAGQGLNPMGGSPVRLAELVRAELARWSRVVKEANIKAE